MAEQETSTRIRCVIVGDESLTIRCGQFLLDGGHHVALVVSLSPAVTGWAEDQGLDHTGSFANAVERLSGQEIDYLFSIANLRILPGELFSLALAAAINFHDGPLPGYCGLNVTSWAILNGEDRHAVSWHLITDEVDGGAILLEQAFDIDPDETAFSLNAKCFLAGYESFTELVARLMSGSAMQTRQPSGKRTVFMSFQRPPHAAVLQFENDAASLSALVRACTLGPDGAGYVNRLSLAKCVIGEVLVAVHALEVLSRKSGETPGTILDAAGDRLVLATGTTDVVLSDLRTLDGMPLDGADLLREAGFVRGDRLSGGARYLGAVTSKAFETIARHEPFWLSRLMEAEPVDIPYARRGSDSSSAVRLDRLNVRFSDTAMDVDLDSMGFADRGEFLTAALCLFMTRLTGQEAFHVEVAPPSIDAWRADLPGLLSPVVPLNVLVDSRDAVRVALERLGEEIRSTGEHATYCLDLPSRYPVLRDLDFGEDRVVPLVVSWGSSVPDRVRGTRADLTISVADEGRSLNWISRSDRYDREHIEMMSGMFDTFLAAVIADPAGALASMPIMAEAVADRVLSEWNATDVPIREVACVHRLIEEQARRTPDATALVFRDEALSYDQLNRQANRLARRLLVSGVEPGALIGIHTDRSLGMVVSVLAVLKAGAAYVPLDPDFPADRLEYMVDHAGIGVVVTSGGRTTGPGRFEGTVIDLDSDAADIAAERDDDLGPLSAPEDLAYVIYTSGSTGRPKGVMIEHRQVVNFFAGMDEVVGHPDDGVWLAVTSLSFDISVLEFLWTLSAGFKVVLYETRDELAASGSSVQASRVPGSMDFSLFYFASDEGGEGALDKYRLLLEGAKFADENGFAAIWTPERHFHAFGGLYPNPSVAGAAVAAITRRVGIRAGSCVSPLHSAIRVAEEWSVVDNLSGGRVGIAFASGWQPHDFVLMPGNFPDRKKVMFQQIEEIRQLWRGDAVTYTDGAGKPFEVRTLPRPVQKELPVWITAAGSPETFRMAGERGFNILTHLLGQTAEGLSEHISTYRHARREAGFDPDGGTVTLMLHTYVGDDDDAVRELVRGPMKAYLLSSVGLVKLAAEIPLFRQKVTGDDVSVVIDRFSEKDMDEVLDFSFERYFETSGLFGTRETCLGMVDRLKTAGVDEIACLIDYGLSTDEMMSQMPALADVMRLANRRGASSSDEGMKLKDLIRTHGVTHLQCTPSMASMLSADNQTLESLSRLRHMLVGGEAFPPALAARLSSHLSGRLTNMYGPTETTIWSAIHEVDSSNDRDTVPIGRPIANTRLYVLDENRRPVPVGVPGELYIGGKGVARGYLRSPEAMEERFLADPFNDTPGARMYRTGDQVRFRTNGDLEFLGRLDHQVKIRGYRIELGEIEAAMALHPDVAEAVVVVREDVPGDRRLTGYFVAATSAPPAADALRVFLARTLPDYMIPFRFVAVDHFPMTPNRKIDRNALPRPVGAVERASNGRAPMNATEKVLAEIWMGVLDVPRLEVNDNFFSLGGNSIIAMSLVSEIREAFGIDLPLVSLFRHPTISDLAEIVIRMQIEGASEEHLMAALADLDDLSEDEDNVRRQLSD